MKKFFVQGMNEFMNNLISLIVDSLIGVNSVNTFLLNYF